MNYTKNTIEEIELGLEQYRRIVESSPMYVFKIDRDYRITYVNESLYNDFGYTKDTILGLTAKEMGLPPESYNKWYMYYDKVFLSGQKESFETRFENKEGIQFFKFFLYPELDENNEVFSITIYMTDTTDIKLIEDERDYIFNFSLDMFAVQTIDGDFLKVNPSWNEILNWPTEKIIGSNWLDFVHPDDILRASRMQEDLLNYDLVVSHETRFRCYDDSYLWLEWNSIPIKHKDIVISVVRNITQWKEISEKLKESEKRYREVVETANYMLYCTDLKGNVLIMNDPGLKLSGLTLEELDGKNLLDLIEESHRETIKSFYVEMIKNEQESNVIEFPIINKRGELIWLMQNAKLKIEDGEPIRIDFISRDITIRKEAETKLRDSEMRLRNVVNSSNEVILVIGEDGLLKDANDTAYKVLEIFDNNLLGSEFKDILFDTESVELCEKYLDSNRDLGSITCELRISIKGDTPLHFKVKGIEYNDGTGDNLLLFLTNITEIRQAQQVTQILYNISRAANLSHDLPRLYEFVHNEIRTVINSKNFAVGQIDNKNKVIKFPYFTDERDEEFDSIELNDLTSLTNRVIQKRQSLRLNESEIVEMIGDRDTYLYGSISKSWLGVPLLVNDEIYGVVMVQDYDIAEAYGEEDEKILCSVSEILASTISKLQYQEELEFLNKDLEQRVTDRTEQLERTLENLNYENDQRKITQEELQITQRELEKSLENEKELHQLKSRFISMVSHEYRTPLTVILSSTNLLSNYMNRMSEEQIEKQYKNISASVISMTNLLDDVLMIGKTENLTSLNIIEFDLSNSIESIIENIKFIDNGKHEFIIDMPEKLCVFTDKKLLDHALGNVISNAVKYSGKDTTVQIQVEEKEDETLEISVIDQGIGIPEEDVERVFESFYRSYNTGAIEGTGLGMSIVKKSIESLQGNIRIESKINVGTKIIINVPQKVSN
ncbi:MAG: PAS domain S-box protein [Candidatus Kapaibacterium sp.]